MLSALKAQEIELMVEAEEHGSLYAVMRMRDVFAHKAKMHRKQRSWFNWVYMSLGSLSVVLAVVVGGLSSTESSPLITGLALTLASLNALLSFTGMEARVQRHETTYRQYEALGNELEKIVMTENLSGDERTAIRDLEQTVFERYDVVSASEPPISGCCRMPLKLSKLRHPSGMSEPLPPVPE